VKLKAKWYKVSLKKQPTKVQQKSVKLQEKCKTIERKEDAAEINFLKNDVY
jgi:hypothetical protein